MKSENPRADSFDVDLDTFDELVIAQSHQRPVLLDLWAAWCAPCLVIAPVLDKVVEERQGEIALARVEVDEGTNMKLAGRYQVRGFPTVLLLRDGKELGRFSGARLRADIEAFIDSLL
jgi:thioredoxin 1